MAWNSPAEHVQNWQEPSFLYQTLWIVRKIAIFPIVGYRLWPLVKRNSTILEYGCGVAPYYYCYRRYFTHLGCRWTLADIPNFTFHYAKYLYRHDPDLEFVTIHPSDFANPLGDKAKVDVVILTTVLEHLDDPTFVAGYLLDRLAPGGLFVFDYIISEGLGLDTPAARDKHRECLSLILDRVDVLHGKAKLGESVGLCIARKKM
jgi:SAM-dependent methyltransferase